MVIGVKLDNIDLKILNILQREGRITKSALAAKVGLSASPCWERLRRLETGGVISGYGARIALNEIGSFVTIFVVIELDSHKAGAFQAFETAVGGVDEITSCHAIGGGFDYLMRVVSSDIEAYQQTIDQLLASNIGMARYYSYIVTKVVKDGEDVPLSAVDLKPKD